MSEQATEARPVRMCDSCGGVDDHPRHVHGTGPNDGKTDPEVAKKALEAARELGPDAEIAVLGHFQDTDTVMKHMDCCRADGCPDGSCNTVTAGAENLRGPDLLEHIQGPYAEKLAAEAPAETEEA